MHASKHNKEIKKEANIKKRRSSSGVDGDKSFNPWSQRNELSDWKILQMEIRYYHRVSLFFKKRKSATQLNCEIK